MEAKSFIRSLEERLFYKVLPLESLRLTSSVLSICSVSSLPCTIAYLMLVLFPLLNFLVVFWMFSCFWNKFSVITWIHGLSYFFRLLCLIIPAFQCFILTLAVWWGSMKLTTLCCVHVPCLIPTFSFTGLMHGLLTGFSTTSNTMNTVERE